MNTIIIVYHSGSGHTEAQAKAVAEGATRGGAQATLIPVAQAQERLEEFNAADAIIFGAPTYMGSVSGDFKKFMDGSGGVWYEQKWEGKIAAGFTNSGNLSGDKVNSLVQMAIFAAQHGMHWVSLGYRGSGDNGARDDEQNLNRLGVWLGAAAQSGREDKEPAKADLATARLLGERVAKVTLQMKK